MRENYTLQRLYMVGDFEQGGAIALDKAQAHYLGTVLRRKPGDEIRVFNGRAGEWLAAIRSMDRKSGELELVRLLRAPQSAPDIWLCFAPVRKHRNAFIAEKATELGVGRFQPVLTERTQFPKINLEKMRAQIIEAAEQTERLDIPAIKKPIKLDDLFSDWDAGRALIFADEAGGAQPAKTVLEKLTGPAAILIGPEGGFSDKERDRLRAQAFVKPVSLGPRILRADTAALALLTLWQANCGDW